MLPIFLLKNGAVVDATGRLMLRIQLADPELKQAAFEGVRARLLKLAMYERISEGVTVARCAGSKSCPSCKGRHG